MNLQSTSSRSRKSSSRFGRRCRIFDARFECFQPDDCSGSREGYLVLRRMCIRIGEPDELHQYCIDPQEGRCFLNPILASAALGFSENRSSLPN